MDLAVFESDSQVGDLLRQNGAEYGPREMAAFNRLDELKQVVKQRPSVLEERFRPTWAADPGQDPTLLGFALERGHREMAKFLIESGAPLNTIENLGATPLHKAARGGDPELIKILVARGLNVNAKDKYQDTPLQDIIWQGKPEAIAALIHAGADVNIPGMNRSTPLHTAVHANRVDVVRLLLAAGADPTIRDADGETVLDWPIETAPDQMRKSASGGWRTVPKVKREIVELLKQAASSKQGGQSTKADRME
jgi:cytohesin